MVAPTGVNEELPGEPAEAGTAGVGTAEAEPSQAEGTQEKTAPTAVVPAVEGAAEGGTAEAGVAEADRDAEEGGRDVSPLAVVGIIFGFIALVGVAVGVLAVVTHGFRHKTVITYRPAAVFRLTPGQCV